MAFYGEVGLDEAIYFAPRGRRRLMYLGSLIAQRYLSSEDRLVGLVGDAGAGKSLLIRGMFPGLVLANDDEGVNIRPLPLQQDADRGMFLNHTYHLDVRFEMAFAQVWQLADYARSAVNKGRRVVVEHFELLYPVLKVNAEVLIGIGEEVIVTRPGVFGPYPDEIASLVFESLFFRKMAHSAEDITSIVLEEMGVCRPKTHGDVRHGFVVEFEEVPDIDLAVVESKVSEIISRDVPINYVDDEHIRIGDTVCPCSGPRLHVASSGQIAGFKLSGEFRYNPMTRLYLLAGLVGGEEEPKWGG